MERIVPSPSSKAPPPSDKFANRYALARPEPDQVASRGPLIEAFAHSLASARDASLLASRLKDARQPVPTEICTLTERARKAPGSKTASVRNEEAGVAMELAAPMVRLNGQTLDPVLRESVPTTVDRMIRSGFYRIDEQLRQQHDR